jgi:hypothetical protein
MRMMITRASWMAWLAASAAAACSSSSGSASSNAGTAADGGGASDSSSTACPSNDMVMLSSTCVPCLMAHCDAEQSAYAGAAWATGSYSTAGGACGDWFMCIATCPCNDTACLGKCSKSAACTSAGTAASDCTQRSCAGDCAVSFASVAGGICVAMNGGTCPTADLIGCCKTATLETCFYPPLTAAEGMQTCVNDGDAGTWSTTP